MQLHIFYTLAKLAQGQALTLEHLVDRIGVTLEDHEIFLDGAIVFRLDGHHHKQTQLFLEHIRFAGCPESLCSEVRQ